MDTFQEIREILKELAISQASFREDMQALKVQSARTEANISRLEFSQEKTDAQLAKTIKKLAAIGVQLGDLGHSNGEHAEALFYESLAETKTLGGIKYDAIEKNRKKRRDRTEDEYDIFLENGNAVGIIEVKYKVQKKHIDKLLTLKKDNFRILFPEFSTYKLYMGIAGLSFESDTEEYAADNGLIVLKNKGKHLEINSKQMVAF